MKKLFAFLIIVAVFASACFAADTGNIPKRIIFKGLNTKAGPLSMDEGESPDCLNVHTNIYGTLLKRSGYSKKTITHQHVTTTPGEFNGLFDYNITSTSSKLVALIDENLYKMDNLDGVFDPLTAVHVGVNPVSDDIASFENFDGTLLFTTWSRDYLRSWNGVTSTYAHVQLAPRGKYIINAYNRLFVSDVIIGSTQYNLRFYYSVPGSFTDWGDGASYSTYDDSSNYETFDAPAGDIAMGWGFCRGSLYGFTKNSVNVVTDQGGANPIVPQRRLNGIGCGAPRSIKTVNIPGTGEAMVWLTNDRKIAAWTGYGGVKWVSDKIDGNNGQSPIATTLLHATNFKYAHAQIFEEKGWYVLFVPTTDSVTIYYAIVYDYKTDTVWLFDRQTFLSSAVVDTSAGNVIYTGDYSGDLYEFSSGNSDNGNTINSYWTSRKWDFGWMPMLKKGKEVQITTKTVGNYFLKYQERYDFDSSWNNEQHCRMIAAGGWLLGDVLPATLGATGAVVSRYDIGNAFNLYQIKLTNNTTNPAFEVYSLDTLVSSTGAVTE